MSFLHLNLGLLIFFVNQVFHLCEVLLRFSVKSFQFHQFVDDFLANAPDYILILIFNMFSHLIQPLGGVEEEGILNLGVPAHFLTEFIFPI